MNVKSTNPRPLRGPLPLVALLLSSCLSSFLCPALAQNPSKFQDDLFVQAADYSKSHSGHAVLIQHQGKILYERYDNWGADTPHMLVDGEKTPQAMSTFQGGMMLTARNWAKFGQFVLDKGSIKKTETVNLLKEDLLMQCFEPSATNNKYGLTWWLNGVDGPADTDIRQNGTPLKVYMAAGLGKQRLYVIPKYDLVVVRFAEPSSQGARFQNDDFMKPILEALVSEKP